jgi:diguanylate cyclase (GGDEF)-like protein/PAS domain S-box-containing protein
MPLMKAVREVDPVRILYVEDDRNDAELLRLMVAGDPSVNAIDVVPTLAGARDRLRKPECFDLVLSDLHLPDGTGIDLLSYIRERRLPLAFVILTGADDQNAVIAALRKGADDYVFKRHDDLRSLPTVLQAAMARYREHTHRLDHMLAAHPSVLFWWKFVNNLVVYPPLWVSDNMLDVLGYTKEEGIDKRLVAEYITAPQPEELARFTKQLYGTGRSHLDARFPHKSGRMLWIHIDSRVIKRDSERSGELIGTWTDITERKEAELRLAESEAKYRLIAESMDDVIWQITPELTYLYVSPSAERQLGYKPEEMIGHSVLEFLPEDMKTSASKGLAMRNLALARGSVPASFSGELREGRQLTKDGRQVWLETKVTTVMRDGKIVAYQGISRDITARKALEERMNFLTHNDPLTGLPNRRFFEIHLQHTLQSARDTNQKVAILLIDLDHFKTVNDSFGHMIGDELLKKVADRLASALRPGDTLARLGGDEFGLLLPQLGGIDEANRIAQKVIESLDHMMTLPSGGDLDIGTSVGISLFPDHAQSVGELIQYADTALYRAKAEGRRTFRHFTEGLTQAARERLSLESNLAHAVERGELQVYYQPVVQIHSGYIVGAEALLRWHRPDGTLIMPDRFIPVAEESGLILPIGEWVLKTACAQMQQWNATSSRPIFIAVNLSPRQFSQRNLADRIETILKEAGLKPALLELEITESALMPEGEHAEILLKRLKATGVNLAIDDFGTGYSSLAYLQRFPFDTLKIDKRFVQNVTERNDDVVIVTAIIRLAKSLNFSLLAEGVETKQQLQFLRTQGCDLYQGFLRSKAVTAEKFARLLEMRSTDEDEAA